MAEENQISGMLIGCCGICCSLCYGYRSKKCPGCYETDCKIMECALSKKQKYCFLCADFPCELYENGFEWNLDDFPTLSDTEWGTIRWKPYSDVYIKVFKFWKTQER